MRLPDLLCASSHALMLATVAVLIACLAAGGCDSSQGPATPSTSQARASATAGTGTGAGAAPSASASAPAAPSVAGASVTQATVPRAATDKLELTDAQWQARLSPEVYQVLRHEETEPAFCGGYRKIEENGPGTYCCAGCGAPLFTAEAKFHSGTGWPSFFQAIPGAVGESHDTSHGMDRTEIHCARCAGHLGHVFDDGPAPTGLRYCVNAAALTFTQTGKALPPLVLAPAPGDAAKPK